MLEQKYAFSLTQDDHFACMDIAGRITEYYEKETSRPWLDKIEEHAVAIKKEWSLVSAAIDEMPACYCYGP